MCGISGIYNMDKNLTVDPAVLNSMTDIIKYRGPDDEGYVLINTLDKRYSFRYGRDSVDKFKSALESIHEKNGIHANLGMGHRRLSIIDLSENGHQPMCSNDNSIFLVFNGEIYNYKEIREELVRKGYVFKSGTDTEVIIHAYEEWGEDCLKYFNGMWAFALWDQKAGKLFCSRDRFGVKPFYYFFNGSTFVFGSEIKQILKSGMVEKKPNDKAVFNYLAYGFIEINEETFFEGIKQLKQSHYLTIQGGVLSIQRYWDVDSYKQNRTLNKQHEIPENFYQAFYDAVSLRLRSDVPVGTALSGGLDSSAIVCVIDKIFKDNNHDLQINTFSSIYPDRRFDESEFIHEVVSNTCSNPSYISPDPGALKDDILKVIWHQEEPFNSLSIFAQWMVMKLVSGTDVKVILDGQGSDEILAGYHDYFITYCKQLLKKLKLSRLLKEVRCYKKTYGVSYRNIAGRIFRSLAADRFKILHKYYTRKECFFINNQFMEQNYDLHLLYENRHKGGLKDSLYRSLYGITPLLHYEDRNSMAFSLESRTPFLDYKLVNLAFSIPDEYKIHSGTTKFVLRESLKGILPEKVRTRKDKMGFVTPQSVWEKNELKDYLYGIINSGSFKSRKCFNVEGVKKIFELNMSGVKDDWTLWRCVCLELWFRVFFDNIEIKS